MSLINHMLSDLQARRGGVRLEDELVLEGLSAVEQRSPPRRSWGTAAVLALVAAVLGMFALRIPFVSLDAGATADRPIARASTAGNAEMHVPVATNPEPRDRHAVRDADARAALPDMAIVDPEPGVALPETALREQTSPPVTSIADLAAALTTPATPGPEEVPIALPAEFDTGLIPVAAAAPHQTMPDAGETAAAGSPPERPPVLIDVQPEGTIDAAVESVGHFEKKARDEGAAPDPERVYREALDLVHSGERELAIERLIDLLEEAPLHVDARLALIELLRDDGRIAESLALLAEGASLHPGDPQFQLPYARILVDQGDLSSALEVLERDPPPVARDPDYHAFLAAVYQRLERHQDAIAAYRGILQQQPGNGVWWMGLGISLMAADEYSEALDAFNRALADSSLSTGLRRYVAQRIEAIRRIQT